MTAMDDFPQQVSETVVLSQTSLNVIAPTVCSPATASTSRTLLKDSRNMPAGNSGSAEKPLGRKGKKPLSLAKDKKRHRFATLTSSPELREAKKGFVCKNTEKSTTWALKNFKDWRVARNEEAISAFPPKEICPADILLSSDAKKIVTWLCLFLKETRQTNGKPFSIHPSFLLSGISRYVKTNCFNIMDTKNAAYKDLHSVRDAVYHDLHTEGVGTAKKQARIIGYEEETVLWENGVMGTKSPEALLHAVFFYNGLNFALCGGQEHRQLKRSQLTFEMLPDSDCPGEMRECAVYVEHGSKNRAGTVDQKYVKNKVVRQYANPELGERCHVNLLKIYLSKLPPGSDNFYYKPSKQSQPAPGDKWFTTVMGHNPLDKLLKCMFTAASLDTKDITNHSLRATAATRLLEHGVADKTIQERTGHRSLQGLQTYQRTTPVQEARVSSLLSKPQPKEQPSAEQLALEVKKPKVEEQKPSDSASGGGTGGGGASAAGTEDVLRKLKFENMHGCTMNVNITFNS